VRGATFATIGAWPAIWSSFSPAACWCGDARMPIFHVREAEHEGFVRDDKLTE
jgi:hypothetical protein